MYIIIILYYYITGDGQHLGQQTSWGPRASQEDPRPSRPPSLLGPQGQRSTHQDHRTQGKNCRSVQEEINCLLSKSLINCSVESLCFIENLFHFQTKICFLTALVSILAESAAHSTETPNNLAKNIFLTEEVKLVGIQIRSLFSYFILISIFKWCLIIYANLTVYSNCVIANLPSLITKKNLIISKVHFSFFHKQFFSVG